MKFFWNILLKSASATPQKVAFELKNQAFIAIGISGLSNLRRSESPVRSKKVYMKKAEEERVKAENAKFAQRLLQV